MTDKAESEEARDHLTPDEEWRASLQQGDRCDLMLPPAVPPGDADAEVTKSGSDHAAATNATEPQWRAAQVLEVGPDGDLVVGYPGYTATVPRSSPRLDKAFAHTREWRAELQPGWLVEVHVDVLAHLDGIDPAEEPPVYARGATHLCYYVPRRNEWWIGTWIRQRYGYFMREMDDVPKEDVYNPTKTPKHSWLYYDPTAPSEPKMHGWHSEDHPLGIASHIPGPTPDDYPEAIEITGHPGYQRECMGVWHRTRWVMAEVNEVDRRLGRLEIALRSQYRSVLSANKASQDLIVVDLNSERIAQPGTHIPQPNGKKQKFRAGRLPLTLRFDWPRDRYASRPKTDITLYRHSRLAELAAAAREVVSLKVGPKVPLSFRRAREGVPADSARFFGDRTLFELGLKGQDTLLVSPFWCIQTHQFLPRSSRMWVADVLRVAARAEGVGLFLPPEMWIAILEHLPLNDVGTFS